MITPGFVYTIGCQAWANWLQHVLLACSYAEHQVLAETDTNSCPDSLTCYQQLMSTECFYGIYAPSLRYDIISPLVDTALLSWWRAALRLKMPAAVLLEKRCFRANGTAPSFMLH